MWSSIYRETFDDDRCREIRCQFWIVLFVCSEFPSKERKSIPLPHVFEYCSTILSNNSTILAYAPFMDKVNVVIHEYSFIEHDKVLIMIILQS
jgi:hypothetical protein